MSHFDVKLVIVGGSGCGKSALLQRLLTGRFARDLPPTYGTEFGAKRVEADAPEGGGARCRPSLGVWDTSGAPRFHEMSRRFLRGADAVLVCWDPSSRASWDSLRAWVADARAVDPSAHIFLAATKADLVEVSGQPGSTAGAAAEGSAQGAGPASGGQPVAAGAAQARAASAEQAGRDLGVSVERWQGGPNGSRTLVADVQPPQQQEPQQQEEQQQQQQQQQEEQQQQQQWQRRVAQQQGHLMQVPPDVPPLLELSLAARAAAAAMPEVKGGGGKLPLAGGSSRAGEAPPPAAPVTPVRSAERPQSPAGGEQVTEAAPGGQPAAGTLGAASGRVSPAERVAAEHAAAAAAELVVSLTGRELPSPFAAAARGPPSEQGAHSERGAHSKWPSPSPSPRPAAGGAGPSRPARPALPSHAVQWASPELSPRSTARSADEWEGPADEQGRHEQLPGGQAAATPPAVPPVAVDAYCSAQGGTAARMMWLSARTGQGVGPAFARIAQEVLSARWSRQRSGRFSQQRQEATQRGGRGLLPRRSATAGVAPVRRLGASPAARTPAGAAAEHRTLSADGRPALPARAASGPAVGAPRRAASGARAPSGSPSPSPEEDSWVREYSIWGSQLGGQPRAPEEQSCRMA